MHPGPQPMSNEQDGDGMLLLDRRDEEVELLSDSRLKEHLRRGGVDDQHLYTSSRGSSAKRLALDGVQNDVR